MNRYHRITAWMIVASLITFLLGITLPLLVMTKFWISSDKVSLVSGLLTLIHEGNIVLFLIIFVFSIAFPVTKLIWIVRLWFFPLKAETNIAKQLHWLSVLGKWSMMDVFVVALLVVTVKLGALADVSVLPGAYFFATSVILTKLTVWRMQQMVQLQ